MASNSGSFIYHRASGTTTVKSQKGLMVRSHLAPPNSGLVGGVRGLGGAVTMERSEDEKLKHPDRINLDRKGLHGIPLLDDEPSLRLLSLQHNFIKRIQHLDSIYRLVFLDLYHNRIEVISNLEPLVNLRVLMLGKNRIRRIDGLSRCNRLSVLDLHGNRITNINGLEGLSELKVLNLAGNLLRKISNLQDLISLEELNVRRNRIRTTQGLEVVSSLEKLYISNNEIQNVNSLQKLEALKKLHTVQMDGNPVWSSTEYAHHLVLALPELKILDQQEIAPEIRANALKWKQSLQPQTPNNDGARKQLLKKMEERNFSISNAKTRWNFLKNQQWSKVQLESNGKSQSENKEILENSEIQVNDLKKSNEECETKPSTPVTDSEVGLTQSFSNPHLASFKSLSRQTSRSNLLGKLSVPFSKISANKCRSSPGSPSGSRSHKPMDIESKSLLFPPVIIRNDSLNCKFTGIERRRFNLNFKFFNLHGQNLAMNSEISHHGSNNSSKPFTNSDKKIGFFNSPSPPEDPSNSYEDLNMSNLISDSDSDSSSSDTDEAGSTNILRANSPHGGSLLSNRRVLSTNDMEKLKRNYTGPKSSRNDHLTTTSSKTRQLQPNPPKQLNYNENCGRTSEQGRDYLIELDGDLLSVYGLQSLKFLDRPWNKLRAMKATTVQFNFVSFDDLVPYLVKFRQTFPNVENFEFLETDINCLGQLNALSLVQGIHSLYIGKEGNPINEKNWAFYAIYRLQHWGLQFINNFEFTEDEILESNRKYGNLGELAMMCLPQNQIGAIIKKFELGNYVKDNYDQLNVDILSLIKDPIVKEIIAKESLQYKPKTPSDVEQEAKNFKVLENLVEISHSALHKLGRLEDEWVSILPILVKRIVGQYSDIRQYKKDTLIKLERCKQK